MRRTPLLKGMAAKDSHKVFSMGAAGNDRQHDDLDVGALGYKTQWPTKNDI